jgi:hypothetical protein
MTLEFHGGQNFMAAEFLGGLNFAFCEPPQRLSHRFVQIRTHFCRHGPFEFHDRL